MNLKPISNNIIAKVEDMLRNKHTYKQIKEVTGISDGTIAKVKQGKITSDRKILNHIYVAPEEYGKIKETLLNKQNEIIKLSKRIEELEIYKYKYLKLKENFKKNKIDNIDNNVEKDKYLKHDNKIKKMNLDL